MRSDLMLKIAICDDSSLFLNQTADFVRNWEVKSQLPTELYTYDNGDELIAASQAKSFDIIFLDILMPFLNGIDAAREIRQHDKAAKIIFLTSSPEFALESYDVKASGYLLKPVTYEKLEETLNECTQTFAREPKKLILKTVSGYQKIYFHEIEYAEAQNKRVLFHLRSGQAVEVLDSFHFFEEQLTADDGFFKCHRSYLVYLPNVEHFTANELTSKSGKTIPIARSCSKTFKEAYFTQMFQDS